MSEQSLSEMETQLRLTAQAEQAAADAIKRVVELRTSHEVFIPFAAPEATPTATLPSGAETRRSPENGQEQYRLPGDKHWLYVATHKRVSREGLQLIREARLRRAVRERQPHKKKNLVAMRSYKRAA